MPSLPAARSEPLAPWPALQDEAARLSAAEPLLQPMIARLFPPGAGLGDVLAARLADVLQAPDLDRDALQGLFAAVLAGDPAIAGQWKAILSPSATATRPAPPTCMRS